MVTPYYSRPPQAAVEAHFRRVADAAGCPLMLYDIPGRTGTRIEPDTLMRLAGHPRIVAVKDCAYDLLGSTKVIARTSLAYYSGCEELNLPLYAVGGAGFVSTVANVAPRQLRAVLDAYDAGDTAEAARLNQLTAPLAELMMASGLPGTVTVKAADSDAGARSGNRCSPPAARRPTACAGPTRSWRRNRAPVSGDRERRPRAAAACRGGPGGAAPVNRRGRHGPGLSCGCAGPR